MNLVPSGGIKLTDLVGEVLTQAERLACIVQSADPDGQGGKIIGDHKEAFATALRTLWLLDCIAMLPLWAEVDRDEREGGIVLSVFEPHFEHDELARALMKLCMEPFGPFGHADLVGAYALTREQIDRLDRNRQLVADLVRLLPDASEKD